MGIARDLEPSVCSLDHAVSMVFSMLGLVPPLKRRDKHP